MWGRLYPTTLKQPKHTPSRVRIQIIVPANEFMATKRNFLGFFIVVDCFPTNHLREHISCIRIFFNNLRYTFLCPLKAEVYRRNAAKVGVKEIGDNILI